MNEFRFVVNGKAGRWQSTKKTSIAIMNYLANMFQERFPNNWSVEFRWLKRK